MNEMNGHASSPPSHLAFFAGARAAWAFLTRIPCGPWPIGAAAMQWAPAWFPVVGCALGAMGSLVYLGLSRAGSWVAAVATLAVLALITGAFHEDGLADSADALGGAFSREKIFVILKDSRIGSFGATALCLGLLLRAAALAKLGPLAVGGLLLGQTLSRMTPVWLMAMLPYAPLAEHARSPRLTERRWLRALVATSFALGIAVALGFLHQVAWPALGLVVVLATLGTVVCGWRFYVRAGGITGDFLGATQQVSDIVILVGLAAYG